LGGSMRQSGVLAAAGIYALDNNVERLIDDHANARRFAELAADIPGIKVDASSVETNIVFLDVSAAGIPAPEISERLAARGVRIGTMGPRSMRAVTHLDVDRAGVEEAGEVLRAVL
jgi:threonine aldolase